MASTPITSWQIEGETMETVTDFIFLGSKITADGDCSHEIKTLAPWKKSYNQPRKQETGGKGDDRGQDGWMASPTQWTWVWVDSGSLVMDREAWRAAVHEVAQRRT